MSAKTRFLEKLQARQASSRLFDSKSQADIAAFCQQMNQLKDYMGAWLEGSGISIECAAVSLNDLLVEQRVFEVPGIWLRDENRTIRFTPIFLYGQGVTGCVEVSLCADGTVTPLSRVFMRSGRCTDWTCTQVGMLSRSERLFDEEAFFEMIEGLIPG